MQIQQTHTLLCNYNSTTRIAFSKEIKHQETKISKLGLIKSGITENQ